MMGVVANRLDAHVNIDSSIQDFSGLMATEQRRIFLLCFRMLRDRDEADMATQDTFIKAYQAAGKSNAQHIEDPAKWLTRIAVNTCLDRLRSRSWKLWKRRPKPEDEKIILEMTSTSAPSSEDLVFARQIEKRLTEALEQLSPRQRAVFLLKHYEDRRLEEIAEILQLDLGTVKAHMSRALAKLRGLLKDLYISNQESMQA